MRWFIALVAFAAAQGVDRLPTLRWTAWFPDDIQLSDAAPAPDGGVYVVGTRIQLPPMGQICCSRDEGFVARLSANGGIEWQRVFGEGGERAFGVDADPVGNVFVVGESRTPGFAGASIIPSPPDSNAVVLKFSSTGTLLRSVSLGGRGSSTASAVAVDATGTAWIVGHTSAPDFMEPAGTAIFRPTPQLGFLVRLTPVGETRRVALMGGARRPCSGGSNCIGARGSTTAVRVALGPGGLIAVGGNSSSNDMRVSANALQNRPGGVLHVFDSSGRALVETYIGGGPSRFSGNVHIGNSWVTSLAFDSEGTLYVGGISTGVRPRTTPGALQSTSAPAVDYEPAGYIYRLDPRTAAVAFTTLVGGEHSVVSGLLPRASGLLVAAAVDARFPTTAGEFSRGPDALVEVAADGKSVLRSARLPAGLAGRLVGGAAGRLFMVNYNPGASWPDKCAFCRIGAIRNNISAFDDAEAAGPVLMGIANAGGGPVTQIIAPGEAVSLFGIGIGPAEPAVSQTAEGLIGTDLLGVRVFFDGVAAPLLYADFEEINAVAPFGLAGRERTNVTLVHNDRIVLERPLRIVPADPAFLGPCRNPDGSPNTPERPAPPGTEISCWITGFGDMRPRPADGEIAQSGAWPVEPVTVGIGLGDAPTDVPWFGQAPAMPAGIVQMNVRLPEQDYPNAVSHPLRVTAGGRTARTALYIRP